MPTAAIRPATTMKARKEAESSADSDVRASTSSQTTASEGEPLACFSALSARSDTCASMSSIEIEPTLWMSSSRRSDRTTLPSSRATSHRIRSPSGSYGSALEVDDVADRRIAFRASSARVAGSCGATIRRWIMG